MGQPPATLVDVVVAEVRPRAERSDWVTGVLLTLFLPAVGLMSAPWRLETLAVATGCGLVMAFVFLAPFWLVRFVVTDTSFGVKLGPFGIARPREAIQGIDVGAWQLRIWGKRKRRPLVALWRNLWTDDRLCEIADALGHVVRTHPPRGPLRGYPRPDFD